MPPYASQQQDSALVFDDHTGLNTYSDPSFVDVPLGSKPAGTNNTDDDATTTTPSATSAESQTESTDSEESSSIFERLMDFNPCMNMGNPSSAIFKDRPCSECGRKCNKMQGYTKESVETIVVDEETGEETIVETKIYFHKWCSQIKEFRQDHKENFQTVMRNLLDHFRALELEAQIKRDAEIRKARQEALKKQAEEAAQHHLQEEKQKAESEQKARDVPSEVSLVEKKPSLMKRVKKSFSMTGCKGNKATMNAVEESAFQQS